MKRKYGVMIATWILWFISVLVPLFCMVLQRVPQRFLTIQFLVILLLGILLCVQWIWLRRAERIQNTAVRGEIEGAGMAGFHAFHAHPHTYSLAHISQCSKACHAIGLVHGNDFAFGKIHL